MIDPFTPVFAFDVHFGLYTEKINFEFNMNFAVYKDWNFLEKPLTSLRKRKTAKKCTIYINFLLVSH